jgi:hypothetical protein
VLFVLLLVSVWGCEAETTPGDPTADLLDLDEDALWEVLPLPDDAVTVQVSKGFDLGFATGMIEPELFEFYATWLRQEGWQQQAPTEAMVTLPHQVWRKDRVELLIEIQGLDELGRAVVWIQVKDCQ